MEAPSDGSEHDDGVTVSSHHSSSGPVARSAESLAGSSTHAQLLEVIDGLMDLGSELEHPHRISRNRLNLPTDLSTVTTPALRQEKKQLCQERKSCKRKMRFHVPGWQKDLKTWRKSLAEHQRACEKIEPICTVYSEVYRARLAEDEVAIRLWEKELLDLHGGKIPPADTAALAKLQSQVHIIDKMYKTSIPSKYNDDEDFMQLRDEWNESARSLQRAVQALVNDINDFGDPEHYDRKREDSIDEMGKNEVGLSCSVAIKRFYEACVAVSRFMLGKANENMKHKEEYLNDIAFLDDEFAKMSKEMRSRSWYGRLICFA